MKLTVIGANGAVPRAGGSSSGYVVKEGETRILLDCGTGVFSQLQRVMGPLSLDAIFITHLHADHFLDLVPFRYALRYTIHGGPPEPLPLYVPPAGARGLAAFAASMGQPEEFFSDTFALREYDPAVSLPVGGLRVAFQELNHYVPSYGITVAGDGLLAYTGDTKMCPKVVELAAGADLFLCEATAQESTYERSRPGHLSAKDAGRVATEADVQRLLLTHIWFELDPMVSLEEARETFGGPIEVAEEGRTYEVAGG